MKLEIEIPEITKEDIRQILEKKVKDEMTLYANTWEAESYVKNKVRSHWQQTADALVVEALNNTSALRKKIADEIEKKLRNKIVAALKTNIDCGYE